MVNGVDADSMPRLYQHFIRPVCAGQPVKYLEPARLYWPIKSMSSGLYVHGVIRMLNRNVQAGTMPPTWHITEQSHGQWWRPATTGHRRTPRVSELTHLTGLSGVGSTIPVLLPPAWGSTMLHVLWQVTPRLCQR